HAPSRTTCTGAPPSPRNLPFRIGGFAGCTTSRFIYLGAGYPPEPPRHSGMFVHEVGEPAQRVRLGLRQHPVAEVEHVTRPPIDPGQDVERLALDDLPRP